VSDTPRTDERTYPADCLGKTLVVNAEWAKQLERENAALRENVDDWENAVAHARDNRSQEQHCTCVPPLLGKVKQLEREKSLQGLHLATMADVVLGENAEDRSDETLVREVCKMARQNRNLVNVLEALAKGKDVPGVTVAEIAEYAQSAVNAVRKEKQ
jgi:hypothetical protein